MEINDDQILDKSDYREIIRYSIDPNHSSIGDYFIMKYNEYKSINHNFCISLKNAIESIKKEFLHDKEEYSKLFIRIKSGEDIGDYPFYVFYKKLYYDFQLENQIWEFPLPHTEAALVKKRTTLNKLYQGYESLMKFIDENKNSDSPMKVKLNFQLANNQIYYLFRSLKENGLIHNTNEQIAQFLKENVNKLEKTSYSTILKEVSRKITLPKNKRIKVVIGDDHKK